MRSNIFLDAYAAIGIGTYGYSSNGHFGNPNNSKYIRNINDEYLVTLDCSALVAMGLINAGYGSVVTDISSFNTDNLFKSTAADGVTYTNSNFTYFNRDQITSGQDALEMGDILLFYSNNSDGKTTEHVGIFYGYDDNKERGQHRIFS